MPPVSFFSMAIDNDDLRDCFVHLPGQQNIPFRMDYQTTIATAQERDAALLLEHMEREPTTVVRRLLTPNVHVYCYTAHPDAPDAPWKIYIPTNLLTDVVRWHHLAHIGISRLADALRTHCFLPRLQQTTCEHEVGRCDPCQRLKNIDCEHGEITT